MNSVNTSSQKSGHLYNNVSFFNRAYLSYLLFSSEGRINRKKYIAGLIYLTVALLVLVALVVSVPVALSHPALSVYVSNEAMRVVGVYLVPGLIVIIYIVAIYAGIVMQIKRLHDLDKSGWFVLLSLVPIVNFLFAIYVLFFKGTEGDNKYGPSAI